GYGDLEIASESSCNLEIALSEGSLFFTTPCCALSPDQRATPGRSPDRREGQSRPVPTDYSGNHGDTAIWRSPPGRAAIWRLRSAWSPWFSKKALLRLIYRSERNPRPISRSA